MRRLLTSLVAVGAFAIAMVVPCSASAEVREITGTIYKVHAAGWNNFPFRIYFTGDPVFCAGRTWAYVSEQEQNYKALTAMLLSARLAGGTVSLTVEPDASGWCRILEAVY